MRIALTIDRNVVFHESRGKFAPGKTFLFSDNLRWKSVGNASVAGPAGTHSGTNRVLRIAKAGDDVYPVGVVVQEYEATWALPAVTAGGTHLDAGQLTVRCVFFTTPEGGPAPPPFNEKRFAITGGTGAYARARGYGIEAGKDRALEVDL